MNWQQSIEITPGVRSGKPCLKGTRLTPADVLDYLAGGMSEEEILKEYPKPLAGTHSRRARLCRRSRASLRDFQRSVKLLFDENLSFHGMAVMKS